MLCATDHAGHVEYSEPPPAAFSLVFVELDVSVVTASCHCQSPWPVNGSTPADLNLKTQTPRAYP